MILNNPKTKPAGLRSPALYRILSLLIILTALCAFSAAPAAAGYVEDGYIDPGFDFPDSDINTLVPIPQYDLRDYGLAPSPKKQGEWSTCWAFSALTSVESNQLKQKKSAVDLSERHLAYFTYSHQDIANGYPGLEGIKGDLMQLQSKPWQRGGGNLLISSLTLSSGLGAVKESAAPYTPYEKDGKMTSLPASLAAGANTVQVKNIYWVAKENREAIQKYLRTNGAGTISIHADLKNPAYCQELDDGTYAYYVPDKTNVNHAVTLIGWDDYFPKENFASNPGRDGAWLVQNSWGNSYTYLWVSYYDKAVDNFGFFETGPVSYNYIYQYDGTALFYGTNYKQADTMSMANVYTARADEKLNAVSFFIRNSDVRYTVEIYKGGSKGDPESGTCIAEQTGFRKDSGCVYVPLKKPVSLSKGDRFSVVITVDPKDPGVFCLKDTSYSVGTWYTTTTYAEPGQSYLKVDSSAWADVSADGKTNLRVKAFTTR